MKGREGFLWFWSMLIVLFWWGSPCSAQRQTELVHISSGQGVLRHQFSNRQLIWQSYRVGLSMGVKLDSNLALLATYTREDYHYQWENQPLSTFFVSNIFRSGIAWDKNDWAFLVMGQLMLNSRWEDFSNRGLFYGIIATASKSASWKDFRWQGGIYLTTFVPVINFWPLLGFRWKISERWFAQTLMPANSMLRYAPSSKIFLGAGHFSFQNATLWAPSHRLMAYELRIFLFADYELLPKLYLTAKGGALLFPLYDSFDLGNEISSPTDAFNTQYTVSYYGKLGLSYRLDIGL